MESEALDLAPRIDALLSALDEAIGGTKKKFEPRPPKKKQHHPPPIRFAVPQHISRVLEALSDKVLAAGGTGPHECGMVWEELKSTTRLTDEQLGLVLSDLIPARVRSRELNDGRIYFLPSKARADLIRKQEKRALQARLQGRAA